MRRELIASSLCLLLAAGAASAQTVIESFEDSGQWTVAGNDITSHSATASVAVNTTDFTEGAGSLAFTYGYSGNAYYEVEIKKTFGAPVDLSDAAEISVDIKGDANSETDVVWYALLTDTYGQSFKVFAADWTIHAPKNGVWKRYTFSLAELAWSEWSNTAFRPAALSSIESVTFLLQKTDSNSNVATTTVLFDNLAYNTTSTRMTETVIDDFNYADTTALLAVWSENVEGSGGVSQTATTLNTSNPAEGTGAMQMDFTMNTGATDWATGQRWVFASPIDLTGIDAWEISVTGDAGIPPASGVNLMLAFGDANGNRARWRLTNGIRDGEYKRFILYPKQDANTTWGATNAWEEEQWDAGGDLNKSAATYVWVYYIDGGSTFPYNAQVLVDNFKSYVSTDEPIETDVTTSVTTWEMYH